MCLRFQFCNHQRVCTLHFLKKVKFVVPYCLLPFAYCLLTTAMSILPTANCLMPLPLANAHCLFLLPTAYCYCRYCLLHPTIVYCFF
jgi:hypothetical protein